MCTFYIFLCVLSTYFYAYFLHICMRTFNIFLCVLSTCFYAYTLHVSMRTLYIFLCVLCIFLCVLSTYFPRHIYTLLLQTHGRMAVVMTARNFLIRLNKINLPVNCKILWYFWSKERLATKSHSSPFAAWLILSIHINNMAAGRHGAPMQLCHQNWFYWSDEVSRMGRVCWGGVGWSDQ